MVEGIGRNIGKSVQAVFWLLVGVIVMLAAALVGVIVYLVAR